MKSNLPVLISMCFGIAADWLLADQWFIFTGITLLLMLISLFTNKYRAFFLSAVCGIIAHHSYNFEYRNSSKFFEQLNNQQLTVQGKISKVKKYPFAFSAILESDSLRTAQKVFAVQGKYQIYLNYTPDFNEGDILTLKGKFALYPKALNEGEFDRLTNAKHNLLNGTLDYPQILNSKPNTSLIDNLLFNKIQKFVISTYNNSLDFKAANFQNALFLGVKTGMEKEDLNAFADSGTLHLLAVSGMHIVFLMLLLSIIKKYLRIPQKLYIISSIAILFGYTLLTGADPSIFRAFLMAAFFLLSYPLKRMINALDLLSGAGIFALLLYPNQLFSLSFQLSYLAVLSIVLIYQRVTDLSKPLTAKTGGLLNKFLWEPVNLSVAVSLGMLPLLLYTGNGYNLLSILANVPLVPLTTLSYLVGIILLITASIPLLGEFIAFLLNQLDSFIFYLIEYTAGMENFIIHYKTSGNITIFLFAVLIYLLAKEIKLKIAAQVVCIVCLIIVIVFQHPTTDNYIFTVKKGNAAYLDCNGEKVIYLQKMSAYDVKSKVVAYLKLKNIRSIDYLVLENVKSDALAEVTEEIKIINLICDDRSPEITDLALAKQINVFSKEHFKRLVKLNSGRIYFYTAGTALVNKDQTLYFAK